ncbi:MAG: hypothetical protein U9Q69_02830 [Nanoarchaeota archaeon]|nr:hypothetical protein [Nanoarchaeota archaeon]
MHEKPKYYQNHQLPWGQIALAYRDLNEYAGLLKLSFWGTNQEMELLEFIYDKTLDLLKMVNAEVGRYGNVVTLWEADSELKILMGPKKEEIGTLVQKFFDEMQ